MNPVKSKDLIEAVAIKEGVPKEDLSLILSLYYSKIRQSLSSLSCPRIDVLNLGTFYLKHWLIDDYIKRYEFFYDKYRDIKGRGQVIAEDATRNITLLNNIKQEYYVEQQRKDFIKNHRNSLKDLEEQKADSGRSGE